MTTHLISNRFSPVKLAKSEPERSTPKVNSIQRNVIMDDIQRCKMINCEKKTKANIANISMSSRSTSIGENIFKLTTETQTTLIVTTAVTTTTTYKIMKKNNTNVIKSKIELKAFKSKSANSKSSKKGQKAKNPDEPQQNIDSAIRKLVVDEEPIIMVPDPIKGSVSFLSLGDCCLTNC